jgi:hypothetical protein
LSEKYLAAFAKAVETLKNAFKKILTGMSTINLSSEDIDEFYKILDRWSDEFIPGVVKQFFENLESFIDTLELPQYR